MTLKFVYIVSSFASLIAACSQVSPNSTHHATRCQSSLSFFINKYLFSDRCLMATLTTCLVTIGIHSLISIHSFAGRYGTF